MVAAVVTAGAGAAHADPGDPPARWLMSDRADNVCLDVEPGSSRAVSRPCSASAQSQKWIQRPSGSGVLLVHDPDGFCLMYRKFQSGLIQPAIAHCPVPGEPFPASEPMWVPAAAPVGGTYLDGGGIRTLVSDGDIVRVDEGLFRGTGSRWLAIQMGGSPTKPDDYRVRPCETNQGPAGSRVSAAVAAARHASSAGSPSDTRIVTR